MKKILIFLLLGALSFSKCSYITEPGLVLRKFIESIRELKLEDKVYCDGDGLKMAYYYSNDMDDIDIGLVTYVNSFDDVTPEQVFNYLSEMLSDSAKIYTLVAKKTKTIKMDDEGVPANIHIRFYIEDSNEDVIMLAKTITKLSNQDSELYFNKDFEEVLKEAGFEDYYLTDDLVYWTGQLI